MYPLIQTCLVYLWLALFAFGQLLVCFGSLLVCHWFACGLPLVCLLFTFGLLLVCFWFTFGLHLVYFALLLSKSRPSKVAIYFFFWRVALEICQMWAPTPQKNATLFWDERSVWWLARKQLFLGSVVSILLVFKPFPFGGTSFWRGPGQ